MAEYYFVLDSAHFDGQARPALTEAWRLRSFEPARAFCTALLAAARDFAERYHTGATESLVEHIAAAPLRFDRLLWRALVGEVLLFSALDIPEFQINAETLTCLLAPWQFAEGWIDRANFAPVQQALAGSRDLTFGTAVYRPAHAGLNTADDIRRLAAYLARIRPEDWNEENLTALTDLPAEDRADELAFAREWFPSLVGLYTRAAADERIIVHESIF
jgi:hypothetical protein